MTLEKYETICWDYDILPGQQICRNCTSKLFTWTEPGEEETETVEQSMPVSMPFESACDILNQFLQLFDSSPLKSLICIW